MSKVNSLNPVWVRFFKLQLHDAIYRLRFYSNSLIHILSLSNFHNNVAAIQKNRGDKSHRVIVALEINLWREAGQSKIFGVEQQTFNWAQTETSNYSSTVSVVQWYFEDRNISMGLWQFFDSF